MSFHKLGAVFFLFALVASGCKKGDDDPFFSLRTRKARLSADWTVEASSVVTRDSTIVFDGASATISYPEGTGQEDKVYDLTWTMSFTRDGEYEIVEVRDYPEDFFGGDSEVFTLTHTEKGTWQFTGGNANAKTKEQLLLLPSEVSSSRSDQGVNIDVVQQNNPNQGRVYFIDRLAADELVLSYEVIYSSAFDQYTESAEIKLKQ